MKKTEQRVFLPESFKIHPAAQKAKELIDLMKDHSVIIVEGETGSGKSVVLPTVIAEHYGRTRNHYRVVVTQNRRLLCESIASYVSESMGCEIGNQVGYNFKGKRKANAKTSVIFETTGTVVSHLKGNPWLSGIQCLVVDEIHEGTKDQHILLSHLKRILDSDPNFRVVLMSATLSQKDKERFNSFFDVPVGYLTVEGRSYPVERKFTGQKFNASRPYKYNRNLIAASTVDTIVKAHGEISEGTILAFLPGKAEIADVTRRLSQYDLQAYSLHAQINEDEKKEAIASITNGKKIVLCTEVARSGLTVEGVRAVISSGYSRNGQVKSENQVTGIRTHLTDWASLKQEGGRTGRTCPGVHYIIGVEEAKRPNNPLVALKSTNIMGVMLNLLATVDNISTFEWFTSPGNEQLNNAFANLKYLGAIELNSNEGADSFFDLKLSNLGWALSKMSVDPQIGKLLLVAKYLGVEKEGAILGSILLNNIKLPKNWSELTTSFEDGSYTHTRKYESDLEAIITEFENGFFGNVEDECVLDTANELLQALSNISEDDMNHLGLEYISTENKTKLDSLKTAVFCSFSHLAGMYVPNSTILDEVDYQELTGGCFYTDSNERALKFETRMNRYNDHSMNGLILIPLDLFFFEKDIKCSIGIEITFEDLKKFSPTQAAKLQLLYNEVGDYQPKMQGKMDKRKLTAVEKLLFSVFAVGQ